MFVLHQRKNIPILHTIVMQFSGDVIELNAKNFAFLYFQFSVKLSKNVKNRNSTLKNANVMKHLRVKASWNIVYFKIAFWSWKLRLKFSYQIFSWFKFTNAYSNIFTPAILTPVVADNLWTRSVFAPPVCVLIYPFILFY